MPIDPEMMERLKTLAVPDLNGYELTADDEATIRHALALIERYRGAQTILYSYGEANEITAHPWWAVVIRNRMGANAIAAGPFFSRERATEHMEAQRHEYGKAAYVFCFSGHASQHYIALRAALSPDPPAKRTEAQS